MFNFGTVVDINDPLNSGRVKVRVNVIYSNLSDEDLPWAFVLRSNDNSIYNNIGLSNHNLVVGQQVCVSFIDEDQQVPIVIGTMPRTIDVNLNTSLSKRTIKTSSGHLITIDDTEGSENIDITDKNGNKINMSEKTILAKTTTAKLVCNDMVVTGNLTVEKNLNVGGSENVSGSSTVAGNISTSGTVTATDCLAGAISLLLHKHGLVTPGNGTSGPSQP